MISDKDSQIILKKASEVPLIEWQALCRTDDQREHWHFLDQFYFWLHAELHSYFSNTELRLREWLLPDDAEIVEIQAQIYIDLYALLREGWREIKAVAKELRARVKPNPDKSHLRAIDIILSASSAGHLLALIIELDCKYHFEQCLTYYEFRPRKTYDFISLHKKVGCLQSLKRDLDKSEIRKIADYQKTVGRLAKPVMRDSSLLVTGLCDAICSTACSEHLNRHEKSKLKNLLMRYRKSRDEMVAVIEPKFHPSKKLKGFSTVNGVDTPCKSRT